MLRGFLRLMVYRASRARVQHILCICFYMQRIHQVDELLGKRVPKYI